MIECNLPLECTGSETAVFRRLTRCLSNSYEDASMRLFAPIVVLLSLCAAPLQAAPPSSADIARYARQLLVDSYPSNGPGAAVIVAHGNKVLFRAARGESDLVPAKALSAGDLFEIGSITKQFTAAGVLKLVEAGKISLDDPLSKYVKDYPNGDNVTLRELLNHTAGLKDYTELPGFMDSPLQSDVTTAQLIDTFKNEKPEFAPGTDWRYDSSGYVLLGAVIESVTGMPWHAYLKQALFQPLGMTNTGYGDDPAFVARRVHGYVLSDGKIVPSKTISLSQPSAAGALVSNVDDLLKWTRALHGGRVLDHTLYQEMITPSGKAIAGHYGFGIDHDTLRGTDMLQHGGSIFGTNSFGLYLPRDKLTVIVLNNQEGEIPRSNDAETLARRIAAYAIGKPYPDRKAIAVDPATLKAYEGVYRTDDKTTRVVRVVNGVLTSQRTGSPRYVLIPIAKDDFLFDGVLSRLAFDRNAVGAVVSMHFFLNDEGEGQVATRTDAPLPPDRVAVTLPRAALERVVGNYKSKDMGLHVFITGDKLQAQLEGQPAADLFAASPDSFFMTVVDATLDFAPAHGVPETVTLHQGNDTIRFDRTP
ncbi:MAG: Serine-type D-Ala-D-Ala carboxypeptidase [Xanthomonadaceae bacterium]|nr:Serine-type D-Ala-D-Ala carboxypeptidase [Xanthomonadaceae bacterium]